MRNRSRIEESRRRPNATATAVALAEDTVNLSPDDSVLLHPHHMEQEVRFRLMSEPSLNFESLVVRRIANGVVLEGVLQVDDDSTDIARTIRRIAGVEKVLNCLVMRGNHELPLKG